MSQLSKAQMDDLVEHVKALVAIHGGSNDRLAKLKGYYKMFHACHEAMSYILCLDEVERLEIHQSSS